MGELRDRMHQDLVRGGYSGHTIRLYLSKAQALVDYFGGRSPMSLTQMELRAFIDHVQGLKQSVQTYRGYLAALKFLYGKTLGRPEMVSWIVYPNIKRGMPVVLTGSEVERLLAAIRTPTCRAVACTIYGAGLRLEEARQLETRDVLSERGLLHIRHAKGGQERFAMLGARLLATLRAYWKEVRPPAPYLFSSPATGKLIHAETIRCALKGAALEVGIKKHVTPHVLRHSFATHQLELGIDLRVIQQLLGHASIRSTSIYAHVTSDMVRRTTSPFDMLGTDAAKPLG